MASNKKENDLTDFSISFFREDAPPKIQNSDCDNCPLCRSRSSQLSDNCERINVDNGTFYTMVIAHKAQYKYWDRKTHCAISSNLFQGQKLNIYQPPELAYNDRM